MNIIAKFYDSQDKSYRSQLDELVIDLIAKYGFTILTGGTIFHTEYQKKTSDTPRNALLE